MIEDNNNNTIVNNTTSSSSLLVLESETASISTDDSKRSVVMDYYDKVIMAPMVRVGTLPMRLLAKEYGCDIAYSEELIDLKVSQTKRVINKSLGTIDFIAKDNTITYRTCAEDTLNVLQLGTASATTALAAAQVVVNDVCAIDINMGCPKFFSVQGGMGSALLSKPDTIKDILTTLIRNLPLPVTCKIRLLEDDNKTIDLMRIIENTGVKAIGVHMRTIPERPRDPAHWDRLKNILDNAKFSVPIIANGDIFVNEDIEKVKKMTGANSVMVARGAIKNISVFKAGAPDPLEHVIKRYLRLAMLKDNFYNNTKYVVNQMIQENEMQKTVEGKASTSAKGYDQLCKIWGLEKDLENYLNYKKLETQSIKNQSNNNNNNNNNNKNNNTNQKRTINEEKKETTTTITNSTISNLNEQDKNEQQQEPSSKKHKTEIEDNNKD
ncbi:tRNA-dihydrouridine synthase 2-like protein [Heterostelium album PN500]|uniref:tRNA-dihydrouridine synthase 2-like protein n=1 Tax=Heterostelium pallidum (strain ATCC 26659 / Pp 5 / PN500) TaxID=670386 RepID=D3BTW3_HETP5|nr:tRNA-dihydrouridine synthase 2-like protein [Heterostelium album PN500]EFA75149.1 tRNA-dihydrouridine synthase 2-like protein [Heterostelium album PN500]|eukprot:XP_020427283.1 tRNA-dihydrouridine synthase 2-like protein [Heterostelium album PN500]